MYRAKNKPSRLAVRILRAPYFYPTRERMGDRGKPHVALHAKVPYDVEWVLGKPMAREVTAQP